MKGFPPGSHAFEVLVTAARFGPLFRAEHFGSFLRPSELLRAQGGAIRAVVIAQEMSELPTRFGGIMDVLESHLLSRPWHRQDHA